MENDTFDTLLGHQANGLFSIGLSTCATNWILSEAVVATANPQPTRLPLQQIHLGVSGVASANRTPTPISRTGFPVRANASSRRQRKSGNAGARPPRSAVVRVKSLNFNFTNIFVISRVDSFCARSTIKSLKEFLELFFTLLECRQINSERFLSA